MEQPLDRLKKILDLLGPGLWLELDQAAFSIFFGGELGNEIAEVPAQKLAELHGCAVALGPKSARFSRAYAKPTS